LYGVYYDKTWVKKIINNTLYPGKVILLEICFNSFYFENSENKHLAKTPTRPAAGPDCLQEKDH